ncbi:MAG: hypothetical protein ACYDDR_14160 [Acidithiobacillus ferrivorans]
MSKKTAAIYGGLQSFVVLFLMFVFVLGVAPLTAFAVTTASVAGGFVILAYIYKYSKRA